MATTANARDLVRAWLTRSYKKQRDLAIELNVSDAYLSQILNGNRRPKLETLVLIERVTGVPVESWVDTEESDLDDELSDDANGSVIQRVK